MSEPRRPRARSIALAAVVGATAAVALPSPASAASGSCDASALQLSLLGGTAIDPVRANAAFTPCADDARSVADVSGLLGIADVQAVESVTRVRPNVDATSTSRVAGARVGVTGPIADTLSGQLLNGPNSIVGQVDASLTSLLGPLASGPLGGLLGSTPILGGLVLDGIDSGALLGSLTGNLATSLRLLLPDVVDAGVIQASAQATCSAGTAGLTGSSNIADLRVLGTTIDANDAANRVVSLDTANLNLGRVLSVDDLLRGIRVRTSGALGLLLDPVIGTSDTNLYDLLHTQDASVLGLLNSAIAGLTGGQTLGSLVTAITAQLQPLLNSININLPAGLLRATVTPNSQSVSGDVLTQRSLALSVSALGTPVLDGVLAEARVSSAAAECAPAAGTPSTTGSTSGTPPKGATATKGANAGISNPKKYSSPEAEAVLQCSVGPATLIDVYGTKGRTYVQGVAERKFVGKTAQIYLRASGKRVGTAKIRKSGLFSTRVALPPSRIRGTNSARYYAVVGGKRTKALKFARRMVTTSLTSRKGKVTFKGRVLAPRFREQLPILIKQRINCKAYKTVARVMPNSRGAFSVTFKAPKKKSAAIYRAQTEVPAVAGSPKRFPTYTLPRVVGL